LWDHNPDEARGVITRLQATAREELRTSVAQSYSRILGTGSDADDRLNPHQGTPLGIGWKRGEQNQAIGRSRGRRNTKIHAIADAKGRLLSILLSRGETHDCPPAEPLIKKAKPARKLLTEQCRSAAANFVDQGVVSVVLQLE
jgi:hypothetical protein